MRGVRGLAAFAVAALAMGAPAQAQEDRAQLCVNQCLFNHGPATSPAYQTCIEQMCGETPEAGPQRDASAPRWRSESVSGAHAAVIDVGDRSLNYMCQPGGPAVIGISGLGGAADDTRISVDGRTFTQPFVARNGILYTTADAASPLVGALMSGNGVEVASGGSSGTFPLTGSRAAIETAARACGIRP